jgi:hypothetical protein
MQHVRSEKFILVLNHGFDTLPLLLLLIFINPFMNTNLCNRGSTDITWSLEVGRLKPLRKNFSLILGHVMWGLWWAEWQWGRFSPSTTVYPANSHFTSCSIFIIFLSSTLCSQDTDKNSVAFSPQANCTDRATTACRRS